LLFKTVPLYATFLSSFITSIQTSACKIIFWSFHHRNAVLLHVGTLRYLAKEAVFLNYPKKLGLGKRRYAERPVITEAGIWPGHSD